MFIAVTRTYESQRAHGGTVQVPALVNAEHVRFVGKDDGGRAVVHFAQTNAMPMTLAEPFAEFVRRVNAHLITVPYPEGWTP